MLYFLAHQFVSELSALNVLTYNTVRAGGAAITAFFLCVFFGPFVIARLRQLKIGQYIKQEHVDDLHKLHKSKAGTPTMGGVLIVGAALLSLLLWGQLDNRLLWLALGAFTLLGAVGFLDDYIKLVRKHNDGLSARAKFAGQILAGTLLGAYLVWQPITFGDAYIIPDDVRDWPGFSAALSAGANDDADPRVRALWTRLAPDAQAAIAAVTANGQGPGLSEGTELLAPVNLILEQGDLYTPEQWVAAPINGEGKRLMRKTAEERLPREVARLNRLVLSEALPAGVLKTSNQLQTKLGIPGLKEVFIPLGVAYVLFVIFVMVAMSNAVNLTDGLDGLAAGTSIVSILALTGIAYVVSRADWSSYLFLIYVPEASEIFVFGAALLGCGLGFLWFNAHPAEVFMGDTGSLALGGAIGTMALLTKQELLLPIVAGIFVMEAGSVVLQVGSFKLTGRRIFRMAPLHHHFELKGWSETKVTTRFYIIAILFALMSLATLKLR